MMNDVAIASWLFHSLSTDRHCIVTDQQGLTERINMLKKTVVLMDKSTALREAIRNNVRALWQERNRNIGYVVIGKIDDEKELDSFLSEYLD